MLLAILIFYHGIGTLATACLPQPFAVPIREVQVYPDIADSYMIGIPAKIGSRPEQDIVLAPWPELNNTWVYDEQLYCPGTVIWSETMCLIRRGHPFNETDSESFVQSLDIITAGGAPQEIDAIGSEPGIKKLIDSGLGGTDLFSLDASDKVVTIPVGIPRLNWDSGQTTLHALGLGSNSTYLNALRDAGHIGASVWSIFWGRMWTTQNPLNGSLVFGGYDRMKILGQNHTQRLDYSTGCWTGMRVILRDILVSYLDGDDRTLFPENTPLPVCIVPQKQLLMEMPEDIYNNFENVTQMTSTGQSFGLHWDARRFNESIAFEADMTIVLDSGLSIRVPNDQYVTPAVVFDKNGSRFNEEGRIEVLISPFLDKPMATLGRYFLTSAYLMVDHDSETFTIWQANPTSDSDLVSVDGKRTSVSCSATDDSPDDDDHDDNNNKVSTGTIVGAVIGSLAGLILILLAIYFLLIKKRRKARSESKEETSPSSSLPESTPMMRSNFSHELPGQLVGGNTWQHTSRTDIPPRDAGARYTGTPHELSGPGLAASEDMRRQTNSQTQMNGGEGSPRGVAEMGEGRKGGIGGGTVYEIG